MALAITLRELLEMHVTFHELLVTTLSNEFSGIEQVDHVAVADRLQPMGYQDEGFFAREILYRLGDRGLSFSV